MGGIPFGNALIKQAVEELRKELPRLRTFATLSPLPGFAGWLRGLGERVDGGVRDALATPGWHRKPVAATLREPLLRLAARYLVAAKRGNGAPLDAVERFHLANGATIERLDWLGDTTARGIEQSHGIMVNYRYGLDRYAANQLAYAAGHTIDASSAVRLLAASDPTVLDDPVPIVSRRHALLFPLSAIVDRAKRMFARAPAQA